MNKQLREVSTGFGSGMGQSWIISPTYTPPPSISLLDMKSKDLIKYFKMMSAAKDVKVTPTKLIKPRQNNYIEAGMQVKEDMTGTVTTAASPTTSGQDLSAPGAPLLFNNIAKRKYPFIDHVMKSLKRHSIKYKGI